MSVSSTRGTVTAAGGSSLLDRLGIPRTLAWGFAGLLLFMIGDGVESGYLSAYLVGEGLSAGKVAGFFTVYGVAAGVAAWLSGALSDMWGPRRVMWIGLGIWVVFQVLFLAVAVPTLSYPLLMLSYGLRGLGYPLFAYGFLIWIAAITPRDRLGTAAGWFWFAFTGGLPTLGSLVAASLIPWIGAYATLWSALVLVTVGGLLALLGVRDKHGSRRLAPAGEQPLSTLIGSLSILWRRPRIGVGAAVRTINTASQFGFLVFMPIFFTQTIGFSLEQWLRMLTVMFATNIGFNLFFGFVGDRIGWRQTIAWFGGLGSAVATLLLYYVPTAEPNYLLALLVAAAYGAALAGYVPLSALMPSLAPDHKGQAMAALNLGAGASTFLGPAVVGLLLGPIGVEGVMWVFAAMHLASGVAALTLRLHDGEPVQPREAGSFARFGSMAGGSLLGHPVQLRHDPDDIDDQDAAGAVKLILFDVGGTLYDDDCFAQALLRAVRELDPQVEETDFWSTYDEHRQRAGGSLRSALADRYAVGDRDRLAALTRRHWSYPAEALYDDVQPVLTALAERYRLGVVAGAGSTVLGALERDGLAELLQVKALADQVGVDKPDRRLFEHALREAGVEAGQTVMVGNRLDSDIRPAHAMGMRTVWMLRGEATPAPTRDQLTEPDAVVTTLTGLPEVLARFAVEHAARTR